MLKTESQISRGLKKDRFNSEVIRDPVYIGLFEEHPTFCLRLLQVIWWADRSLADGALWTLGMSTRKPLSAKSLSISMHDRDELTWQAFFDCAIREGIIHVDGQGCYVLSKFYQRYGHLLVFTTAEQRRRKGREFLRPRDRFKVFERDGFRCAYCGASAPDAELVVDHIKPVSKGGTNSLDNLRTACRPCNAGKAAYPLKAEAAS